MKKLLLGFVALVAVALLALLGVASTQPDTYHVERSVTLAAAPADAFPYINDYQKWFLWNPWQHIDPTMKSAHWEITAGVGAWNSWEGNKDAGKGKMTILESVPDQKTVHDLHFIEPFEDHAKVTFALSSSGEQTTLNWSMDGDMNIISKVMCLFTPMDAMIGPDYERGFKTLKPLVEADATARKDAEAQKAAADAAAAAAAPATPVTPSIPLHLVFQNAPRRARVYVPPRASRRVLILFDGQNVFGDEGSFAGGWHADATVAELPGTVDRPIVVALDHGRHHRNRELWTDLNPLLDLLEHDLLPLLRDRWKVEGPVVLGGASLGGLAAMAGYFRRPEVFGGALCLSPSFWYDRGAIFGELPKERRSGVRLYVDVGMKEGRLMYPMAHRMVEALRDRGFGEKHLLWRPDKRGTHNEKHWRRRLRKALHFMFRR